MASIGTCKGSASGAKNTACPPIMAGYCSTNDSQTYLQKWQGDTTNISGCLQYVDYNVGDQSQYRPVVDAYVRRYLITDANPITYPQQGSAIYKPSIEDVINVCSDYPGGCDSVLTQVCAGYTRNDLGNNPNLGKLCGCFMNSQEYDNYAGTFGVQPICDPACVIQSVVKPRDNADQSNFLRCNQAICVIDDVTISILGKSNVGDINFSQACAACSGGAGCTCNISDISIQAVESTVGDINFSQQCGGNVRCYKSDVNGVPKLVNCSELGGTGSQPKTSSSTTRLRNILIIGGIILLIVIIIIVVIVVVRRGRQGNGSRAPERPYQYNGPPPLDGGSGFQYTPASSISGSQMIPS